MNRLELLSKIDKFQEDDLTFSVEDSKAYNRFDSSDKERIKEWDYETEIAYCIYSWVVNAVVFKTQEKELKERGFAHLKNQFGDIVSAQKKLLQANAEIECKKALKTLTSFLFEGAEVKMNELYASFSLLAVMKVITLHPKQARKVFKVFEKKTTVVFNLVTLFFRSIYHAFFTRKDFDSSLVHPDYLDLSNGIFTYDKMLVVPTWQNAFTIDGYKAILKEGVNRLSTNYPLSNLDTVSIVYFTKDISVTCSL